MILRKEKTLFQPKSPKVLNNAGRLTKEPNNTTLHWYYHIPAGKLMTLILEFMFFWSAPKKIHVNNSWVNMVTLPANALHIVRPSKFSGPIKHRRAAHCAQWQHASRRKKIAAEREGDAKNPAKWTPILSFHHDESRGTCIGSHLCFFSDPTSLARKKTLVAVVSCLVPGPCSLQPKHKNGCSNDKTVSALKQGAI